MVCHNNQAVSDNLQLSVSDYRELCVCVYVCISSSELLCFVMLFSPLSGQIFLLVHWIGIKLVKKKKKQTKWESLNLKRITRAKLSPICLVPYCLQNIALFHAVKTTWTA